MINALPPDEPLGPQRHARIASLIAQELGIQLTPSKRDMVEGRLRRCARVTGHASVRPFVDEVLEAGVKGEGWDEVVNALTTNKTDFFREPAHYDLLETRLAPELIRAHRGPRRPRLKLWSAAVSTGAELWSAGMVLGALALARGDFDFALLGTDVAPQVLAVARRAVYPNELLAPAPPALAARWLRRGSSPSTAGMVRIAPELRARAAFMRLNLMDPGYPVDRDVDVIFLRNVLIYFSREDQSAVVSRLVDHLRPGGYLILGHSEAHSGDDPRLEPVAPAVFRLAEGRA